MERELEWLKDLSAAIPELRETAASRPYWSQRQGELIERQTASVSTAVRRIRRAIKALERGHWFARTLGFNCVDGHGEVDTSIEDELDTRIGKPDLLTRPEDDWSEDDLCDFVEVYHDLAARPTSGWDHPFGGCGFHPSRYSQSSGQRIYRSKLNSVLDASNLGLRLAEEGEDTGRIVRVLPDGLDVLTVKMAHDLKATEPEVPHAIAMFRRHNASREDRRSAVLGLARVLEARRELLKEHLLRKDEGALFQIANAFDLRHSKADQMSDYSDAYLDWIFHWYLATIELSERLTAQTEP